MSVLGVRVIAERTEGRSSYHTDPHPETPLTSERASGEGPISAPSMVGGGGQVGTFSDLQYVLPDAPSGYLLSKIRTPSI